MDLINGTSTEFDLDQCFEQSGEDAKAIYAEAKSVVTSAAADAHDSTKDYGEELWTDFKAATNDAINYTDGRFAELWDSATSGFTE
jgi:ElaB/YqjD/DUF883 family membrane-anchored ribosome-binding protein